MGEVVTDFETAMPEFNELFLDIKDVELIQDSVILLDAIRMSAEKVSDLQTETTTEIYSTCLLCRKRIIKINAALNISLQQAEVSGQTALEAQIMNNLTEALQLLDTIDNGLKEFKFTYAELKKGKKKKQSKKRRQEEEKEEETEVQANEQQVSIC